MTGHSDSIELLAISLVKAQGELQNIEADAEAQVSQRKYRYLSLHKLLEQVRPILTKHGLCIVQTCEPSEPDSLRLTTTLLHVSGEWLGGTCLIPLAQDTPQGYGSALTYARRYSLQAIIGVAADEDDDAAAASKAPRRLRVLTSEQDDFFRLKMNSLNANANARKRFFAELSSQFSWNHEKALEKLGIESFSKDIPEKTVGEVLGTCQLIYASERN